MSVISLPSDQGILSKPLLIALIIFDLILLLALVLFSPLYAIGFAIVVAALALIYIPRLGYVYFLILWLPIENFIISDAGSFEFYRLALLVLLLILAWGKFLLSSEKIDFPNRAVFVPIVIIYIWSGLSTILSPYPVSALPGFLRMVTYFAMFILVYNLIRDKKDLKHLLYVALISLLPTMLAAIYQWHSQGIIRTSGFFKNPNTLSMYAIFAISISFILWRKWQRNFGNTMFFILALGIFTLALFVGGARASLLSFLVFVLAYIFRARHYRLLAAIVVTIVMGGFAIYQHSGELTGTAQAYRLYSGSTGRMILWENSIPMILDNPVLGVGYGAVGDVFRSYIPNTHPIIGFHLRGVVESGLMHNGFVQKAAEIGLVGLALYLWANLIFMWYLAKIINTAISPFVANACLVGLAFMLSRMALSLVESAVHFGPLTTQAGMMVILTGILKVADIDNATAGMADPNKDTRVS